MSRLTREALRLLAVLLPFVLAFLLTPGSPQRPPPSPPVIYSAGPDHLYPRPTQPPPVPSFYHGLREELRLAKIRADRQRRAIEWQKAADARHERAVLWQKQADARHKLAIHWELKRVAVVPNLTQTMANLQAWDYRYQAAGDRLAAEVAREMFWYYRHLRAVQWARPKPPPAPALSWGQHVEAEARTWLGVSYRWGGASRSGVDCSGFTMLVYRHLGIYLPHLARGQQALGYRVSTPAKGDLVFFGWPAHHVGIYIGGGRMIHAPHTGDVVKVAPVYGGANYRRYH